MVDTADKEPKNNPGLNIEFSPAEKRYDRELHMYADDSDTYQFLDINSQLFLDIWKDGRNYRKKGWN